MIRFAMNLNHYLEECPVATSDNVVKALSEGCIPDVVTTTQNYRCYNVVFSTSIFRPGINVSAMSWFWFPDENLNVFQYHYNFFFKRYAILPCNSIFWWTKFILYVSMQSVHSNGGYLKICSLLLEQRKEIFDLV